MRYAPSLCLVLAAGCGPALAPPVAHDALDEVNAVRAWHGLPPFARDSGLAEAAMRAASYRAQRLIEGHTWNDFRFVPRGSHADAAGCAAWRPETGWGSCCTYDRYRAAGAAWAMGRDGRRYMHLFVSGEYRP